LALNELLKPKIRTNLFGPFDPSRSSPQMRLNNEVWRTRGGEYIDDFPTWRSFQTGANSWPWQSFDDRLIRERLLRVPIKSRFAKSQ
jgi:hypothetical protein